MTKNNSLKSIFDKPFISICFHYFEMADLAHSFACSGISYFALQVNENDYRMNNYCIRMRRMLISKIGHLIKDLKSIFFKILTIVGTHNNAAVNSQVSEKNISEKCLK